MNAPVTRLFVAVDPSDPVCETLAGACRGLDGARWTRPDQYHVTLRFLGPVDDALVPRIARALRAIDVPAFDVEAKGFGVFPSFRAPRVLWSGLLPPEPLEALHAAIETRVAAAGVAAADEKRFSPHLTLARLDRTPGSAVRDWIGRREPFSAGPWRVDAFILYASTLTPSGAIHRKLEIYPLAARAPSGE